VVVMRSADAAQAGAAQFEAPPPVPLFGGCRLALNATDSLSGCLALKRDLEAAGSGLQIFRELIETGGHRASIRAVAQARADVAAIDCKTWGLALRFEPAARELGVAGRTGRRKGLPFVTAASW
jgi:ABC-type phosphate/phosphonate transport system substrate-binding protein